MKGLIIVNPGLLTSIQANPRTGFRKFGVPGGGAMDIFSMNCGNWLVGNKPFAPLLESTLLGPEIKFLSAMLFSITGAECKSSLDNQPVQSWRTCKAEKGSVLKISPVESGTRIYISFSGGVDVDEIMGSASTYLPAKIGGLNGHRLMSGDTIRIGDSSSGDIVLRELRRENIPVYSGIKVLRTLAGPDFTTFDKGEIDLLFNKTFKVSLNSDRMGIRLEGTPISNTVERSDVISYGIHHGAIQIPGDGRPIIMCADAQTTGGYRQIGNVITADLDILAQLSPSQEIRFSLIDYSEAIDILKEKRRKIEQILI